MTLLRSAIVGVAAAFAAYIGILGVSHLADTQGSGGAVISDSLGQDEVTVSVTPRVAPVPKTVALGATVVTPHVAPVSPTVTPTQTPRISPTPWSSPSPTPTLTLTPNPLSLPSSTPTPSATPWPTPTPTPSPSSSPTTSASPTPSLTPSPLPPTPSSTPTPTPTPDPEPQIIFSEIAWSGTTASQYGEWIELHNVGESAVDLSGWAIYKGDQSPVRLIELSGSIGTGSDGYFLIERITNSSPDPITDIAADVMGAFGGSGLKNSGEMLTLRRGDDIMAVLDFSVEGWPAGTASSIEEGQLPYSSMERGPDGTWHDGGSVQVGQAADGSPINGTPRSPNSSG